MVRSRFVPAVFSPAITLQSSSPGPVAQLAEQQTLNLRVVGSIPTRLTILSSASSDGAKYLKNGTVAAVRLNRFPSNAIPSGKNSCWSRCF
jgi:hypothetical protein